MSNFGNTIRARIPANGKIAKSLVIFYIVWLYVIVTVIVNVYGSSKGHRASSETDYIILGVSFLGALVPAFISTLHEGVYGVLLYGGSKKQRQKYLNNLDERQLQTRRKIFETSYAILASLTLLVAFVGVSWLGNLPQDGIIALGYNYLVFVVGLPSMVAVWDKATVNRLSD